MLQAKISRYEVRISPRTTCVEGKTNYNADYTPDQVIEASNYFQTLVERYQCFNYSNPTPSVKQGMGQFYTITLTTIFDDTDTQQHCNGTTHNSN